MLGVQPGSRLRRVADEAWVHYRFEPKVSWLHILEPNNYNVLPFAASTPLDLQLHHPGGFANQVLIRQDGAPVPLLKHLFSQKVRLNFDELQRIADYLELQRHGNSSRAALLEQIARYICQGDRQDEIDAYVNRLLGLDGKSGKLKIDPMSEFVFNEMTADDQKEFGDLGKRIADANKKRKLSDLQKEVTMQRAGRGRGGGKRGGKGGGKGHGQERGQGVPPSGSSSSSSAAATGGGAAAAAHPQQQPEGVQAARSRASGAHDPVVFDWGSGSFKFHFTQVVRVSGEGGIHHGYSVTCHHHPAEPPLRSTTGTPRPCSRELSLPGDKGIALDTAERTLKAWCLKCCASDNRSGHMSGTTNPRMVPSPLPAHADLNRKLEQLLAQP